MKCPQCRTPMTERRENHRYDASGLPNVVLVDVEVRRCPACGEQAVAIPRIEELHRALAMSVIRQPGRLTPQEIRYLRKWLGWSGADFAKNIGVDPATVSRWESVDKPQAMGVTAERFLRLAVAHGQPAEAYPVEAIADLDERPRPKNLLVGMKAGRSGWAPAAIAA